MRQPTLHKAEHSLIVSAPSRVLYDLVADVTRWPAVFGPTVAVRHLERSKTTELFEIWALVNGAVANWTSRRVLAPDRRYVRFQQVHSQPPVATMGGAWLFRELPGGKTEVVLRHRFSAVEDDPTAVAKVREALDRNSPAELAALARLAEQPRPVGELVFSFTDTVSLRGTAADAYAFVDRADLWRERLPHVRRVRLVEDVPGVQDLEMDTVTPDGAAHTTRSWRVCRAPEWIAYKQTRTPRLLTGHAGEWTFAEGPEGPVATARHTVAVDPDAIAEVLGADATLADARATVRAALGRNSLATLAGAGAVAA
jgi:aromatase